MIGLVCRAPDTVRGVDVRREAHDRSGTGLLMLGLVVIGYTHLGYPLLIVAAARFRGRRDITFPPMEQRNDCGRAEVPSLTVIIAAYNEERLIEGKVRDTWRQDYPRDRLHVLVVTDGSTDSTAAAAERAGACVLNGSQREGKSAAVNRGIAAAGTELVCLSDANCVLAPDTLRAIVQPFNDPRVAVVSGVKSVGGGGASGSGESIYWRLESRVKAAESVFGAVMGAPGEICGLRRSTVRTIPPGVINDDYHLTCDALSRRYHVRFASRATASEMVSDTMTDELERRTRIAAGTCQTTLHHLELADPRRGWTAVAFISHRVLRTLVAPALLPLVLTGSAALAPRSRIARIALSGQLLAWTAAALGAHSDRRALAIPYQFALTNVTTLRGAVRYLSGRQPLAWRSVRNGPRPGFVGENL